MRAGRRDARIITVETITADRRQTAIATIVLAFAADPLARWIWPRAGDYLANMPQFVSAFAGNSFTHGGARCTQDCAGVALWLPPGIAPDDDRIREVIGRTVPPGRLRDDLAVLAEQMSTYHPSEPHWYLPLVGVDPAQQGAGHGGALLTHAVAQFDRDGVPAYLEASSPRNASLYQRHGFSPVGRIQIGTSPLLVPMVRTPRSRPAEERPVLP